MLVCVGLFLFYGEKKGLFEPKGVSQKDWEVGQVLKETEIDREKVKTYFTVEEISKEMAQEMTGKSYRENANIALSDLRYLRVLHYNFNHEIQVGELVVNQAIAKDCQEIFLELFQQEYEIRSMYRIDRYYKQEGAADADCASINEDNTSGFNYRNVNGTKVLSQHAYGCAIDINPMENPTMAESRETAIQKYLYWNTYSNRTTKQEHMISRGDICYEIFIKHGFIWGGEWEGAPDYQHFEKGITP